MNTKIIIGVVAIAGLFVLAVLIGHFRGEGKDKVQTNQVSTNEISEASVNKEVAVSVPADMPTNVPMYPGAVLKRVQDQTGNGERNITLTLETGDSIADVNTWYRGALKENGWAVTSDKVVGGYVLLKGEKENLTTFTQVANGSDGKRNITQRIRVR